MLALLAQGGDGGSVKRDLQIASDIRACDACPLAKKRQVAIPAEVGARYERGGLAFLVDIPGAAGDAGAGGKWRPLNPTERNDGRMFESALEMAGLDRGDILVMCRVRCQPPRNRIADYPEAFANCEQWNVAEMEAYDPAVVVLLGSWAMKPVFGAQARMGETRGWKRRTGEKFQWGGRTWLATWSPRQVVMDRDLLPQMAADFAAAREVLNGKPSDGA